MIYVYVCMHLDLTVRENLYYAAMLRLPSDMKYSQKLHSVEDVLSILVRMQSQYVSNERTLSHAFVNSTCMCIVCNFRLIFGI